MFILLRYWYEGDGWLVDNSFVACSDNIEKLIEKALTDGAEVYLPEQEVPNDGSYGDERIRYRIIVSEPL